MLARILLLLSIALAHKTYILEDTKEISMYPGETVVIDSPTRKHSALMWVIGRFPSNKIIPNEGRLGDRFSERKTPEGQLIQTWSISATNAKIGDSLDMDFWYLRPHYAEQYYNDPEAYEAMHGEKVETRIITFKIVNKEL